MDQNLRQFSTENLQILFSETNVYLCGPRLTGHFPPTYLGASGNILISAAHFIFIHPSIHPFHHEHLFLFGRSRRWGISCLAKRANAILLKKHIFFCCLRSAQRDECPNPFERARLKRIRKNNQQIKNKSETLPTHMPCKFMLLKTQVCPIAATQQRRKSSHVGVQLKDPWVCNTLN